MTGCVLAIQWFRHRFNDCFDKAEWSKSRSPEEMPESASYAEKLIYDKAIELVSHSKLGPSKSHLVEITSVAVASCSRNRIGR